MGETVLCHPAGPSIITKSPRKILAGEQEPERLEDSTLLALKVEKAPGARECWRPVQAGKSKEKDSPREPREL